MSSGRRRVGGSDAQDAEAVEDRSHLYRMRQVKYQHRGLPSESKAKWREYVRTLYQQINQACRMELTDPAGVMQNSQDYDLVAAVLGLKESVSPPRESYAESSEDTIINMAKSPSGGIKTVRKSIKSVDILETNVYNLLTSSSMSQQSSSNIELTQRSDEDRSETRSSKRMSTVSRKMEDLPDDDEEDLYVNPPTPPPEEDVEPWVDKRSPYQKFFSLAEYKATRWRRGFSDSKPRELLTVQEKEEHLYNSIASDFCKWVAECQFKNVQLDETTVTELFQVGMETPAVKAMCVQTKELPIVPAQVAQIFGMPEKSEMAGLKKQVQWDVKFAKLKAKGILDKPRWKSGRAEAGPGGGADRGGPRSRDALDKWFSTNLLRREEKTGELLWTELEKTKVFKHFCNWMIDNDKYKKPQYLDKKGYFKSKYHIDESDMVRVVRMESERAPIVSTVVSARSNLEGLIATEPGYGAILDDLVQDIPSLKTFLGFDVAKRIKAKDSKKKKDEWTSPVKPLTEGLKEDAHEAAVHHMALINHPEWP